MNFWADVSFEATGGRVNVFLQKTAENHMKLRNITPTLGGVKARCKASLYVKLSKLAKKYHVNLKLKRKNGLYFLIRPLLNRKGVWIGFLLFIPFWLFSQNFIWNMRIIGADEGQMIRIQQLLFQDSAITTGAYVTTDKLESCERAMLSLASEFSWASLNFSVGRLTVEVIEAKPVPSIKGGEEVDLISKVNGKVVSVNVEQGTPAVKKGEEIAVGQILVNAAKLEHDKKSFVSSPTFAEIKAQFTWQGECEQLLTSNVEIPVEKLKTYKKLFFMGREITCFSEKDEQVSGVITKRTIPVKFLGFNLPMSVFETNYLETEYLKVDYSKQTAVEIARYNVQKQLYAEYPDVEIIDFKEKCIADNGKLIYEVSYEVIADIVKQSDGFQIPVTENEL